MPDFVRVKTEGGVETTVPAAYAVSVGLDPLDKPAADRFGRPLPDKPRVNPSRQPVTSAEAPAEAPARKGTTSKEKK